MLEGLVRYLIPINILLTADFFCSGVYCVIREGKC